MLREAQEIGRKIKLEREKGDLSQPELAEKAGLSIPFLKRVELGNATISAPLLARIAKALKISTDSLLQHIESDEDLAKRLWKEHNLDERTAAAGKLDFSAKKAILKSMGLWKRE